MIHRNFRFERRAAYAAFSFLVVLKPFMKVLLNNARAGAHLSKFALISPLGVLGLLSGLSGGFAGYLKPSGQDGAICQSLRGILTLGDAPTEYRRQISESQQSQIPAKSSSAYLKVDLRVACQTRPLPSFQSGFTEK